MFVILVRKGIVHVTLETLYDLMIRPDHVVKCPVPEREDPLFGPSLSSEFVSYRFESVQCFDPYLSFYVVRLLLSLRSINSVVLSP